MLTRQPQLFAQQPVLVGAHFRRAQLRHEKIQPDFAHCHQLRIVAGGIELIGQLLQLALARRGGAHRVNAQRIGIAPGMRQLLHLCHMRGMRVYGRNHAQGHALLPRTLAHGIAVGIELGRVQVAVRVDPETHATGSGGLGSTACSGCSTPCVMRNWRSQRLASSSSCVTSTKAVPLSRASSSMRWKT